MLSGDSTSNSGPEGRPVWRRLLTSWGAYGLAAFLLAVWLIGEWLHSIGGPEVIRARYGVSGAWLLVPLQGVISATPFPGEAVAFANSAIYGFWIGMVFSWAGWMIGAFIQYGFAWRVRGD